MKYLDKSNFWIWTQFHLVEDHKVKAAWLLKLRGHHETSADSISLTDSVNDMSLEPRRSSSASSRPPCFCWNTGNPKSDSEHSSKGHRLLET